MQINAALRENANTELDFSLRQEVDQVSSTVHNDAVPCRCHVPGCPYSELNDVDGAFA